MKLKMNKHGDYYLPKIRKSKGPTEKQIAENEAWIAHSLQTFGEIRVKPTNRKRG